MSDLTDAFTDAFWRIGAKDADAVETREWLDAFDAIIEHEGRARATYLLRRLLEHARVRKVRLPPVFNTPYCNTIALADQQGTAIVDQKLSVQLVSPVDSRNDAVFVLVADGPGRYRGVTQAGAGQWDLVIEAKRSEDAVFRSVSRVSLQ